MKASPLLLDRLEFSQIHISTNSEYKNGLQKEFPQLAFGFKDVFFQRRSAVDYPPEEANDPRHFVFKLGIKLDSKLQKAGIILPYNVEAEAIAFFRYITDEMNGADRFRAVRASGYPMLYGAIREMVANLTARSSFGLWQLPSANFSRSAEQESKLDEEQRLELIRMSTEKSKKPKQKKKSVKKNTIAN